MGTLLVRGLLAAALLLTVVFPAWAQDGKGIGVVTALTGRAGLKRPQAPETSLKLRDNLFVRDVVDTQKESLARILLMGKSTVTVRELSRFEIREEVRPDGSQRALINLAEGRIRVMVARRLMRPGDEVEIRTPNAIAAVRGSDGVIEVSKLPDGRPQTVITGVSGEFHLTLPTTPPFIANGREFQDGPALAGGAPSVRIAMAETVSDAGSGLQLAQLPTGLNVTALLQAQITGAAGAQALAQAFLTQAQVGGLTAGFQTPLSASGFRQLGSKTTDKVAANGEAAAYFAAAAAGLGGTANGGGGGSLIAQTPITPVTTTPIFFVPPVDLRISVLVYDSTALASLLNGVGSGKVYNATYVSSATFATMSDFSGFKALVVGSNDHVNTTGLLANGSIGTAINGNQVISGLHVEHGVGQANQFIINAVGYAVQSGSGKMGLVATTDGCGNCFGTTGSKNGGWIAGSFLQGSFQNATCSPCDVNKIQITRNVGLDNVVIPIGAAANAVNSGAGLASGQALTGTSGTGLSGWNASVHSTFSNPPAATGYQVIQKTDTGTAVTLVK
jgi:hypothetical protein